MPNHVKTLVKTENKEIIKTLTSLNNIIPMPVELANQDDISILNMEHFDNLVCSGARSLADFLASPPEYLKGIDAKEVKENWQRHVHQIIDNQKKYKHPSDFRWGLAEWGTRSDSYDYFELPGGCGFLTAWNHPEGTNDLKVDLFFRCNDFHKSTPAALLELQSLFD